MDILDKIDSFLEQCEQVGKYKFIPRENALKIIESIIESVPEDEILLDTVRVSIDKEWKISNKELVEKFYKILQYYGILEEENCSFRKTILEKKGNTLVRKFVTVDNKKFIKKLLD
jgi:hypothetical protein